MCSQPGRPSVAWYPLQALVQPCSWMSSQQSPRMPPPSHTPSLHCAMPPARRCSEGGGAAKALSRKQRKLLQRMKIAELKQACARPDVVEVWDVTAPDPNTLVTLKVRVPGGVGACVWCGVGMPLFFACKVLQQAPAEVV